MGTSVTDTSGNGNAGSIGNATWTAQGRYGSALSFNGTNARVLVADSNSLDLTTAMTLEAWVYPTAIGGWRDVIYKEVNDVYYLMGSSDQGTAPAIGSFATGHLAGSSGLPLNTWSHLAGTYDGATLRLYVNGVLVASEARTGTMAASTAPLSIGGDTNNGQYFAGRIDEVRVYRAALTASQIQTDMATAISSPDTQLPSAPSNLSATAASSSRIDLSWTAATDNVAVTGYRVERCQGAGCSNFSEIASTTATSYSNNGLSANTSYSYRVRAVDTATNLGPYSNQDSATTPLPDAEPPSAPSNLSTTAVSASQINVTWTASTDNVGVTGYRVERCQDVGCSNFVQVATPSGTSYDDTGLAASTSYSYRVRATDAAGNLSGYSNIGTAVTPAAAFCSRSSAVWLTGMEHGVVSTAGGGIFSTLTGTPTADGAVFRNGAYSLRINDVSAASTVRALRSFTASNVVVTRFAIRLSSLPGVTSNLAYIDSGTDLVFRYNAASQRFQLTLGASTVMSATTVSAATWYVIDLRYDLSANPHLGDWRVDGVAQTQVSRAAAATTANGFGMGATANASVYTANYDDILVADQPSAYPVGNGRVVRLVPDSMGTSSGATNFSNDDGTAINATSWQRLDEVPMTSIADYVRQQANSGTSYVEFGFQNTAETCIHELSAVLAYHAAGTAADNGKTSIFDGATGTVVFSGDMSQTALQYKRAVVTPAASPWTQAAVNGLVARVGYSTDSNPNPYWDAIVLEAAVNEAQVSSRTRTGNILTSTNPLRVGSTRADATSGGVLDEIRIYNVASTATQVQADMKTPIATSPLAWLPPTLGSPALAEYLPHGSLDRPTSRCTAWTRTHPPGSVTRFCASARPSSPP